MSARAPSLDVATVINAPPELVLRAFFDPAALGAWLRVRRSVAIPRTLGPYALEWPTSERHVDEVLGPLGGAFRGTVIQFDPGHGFFLADTYWLPPDGDPLGPMALTVTCSPARYRDPETGLTNDDATAVRVEQTGYEDGARWHRYYELAESGMEQALRTLKALLEP